MKEGFHFGAFLFQGFWALTQGLHIPGMIGISGTVAAGFLFPSQPAVSVIGLFALMLVFGTLGNAWRINHLYHHGYRHLGTLKAPNKKAAEQEARNFYSDLKSSQ
ncbi:MAG TPA: hypothetical protein VGH19_07825 [Verrucomicrobiae bacterium]